MGKRRVATIEFWGTFGMVEKSFILSKNVTFKKVDKIAHEVLQKEKQKRGASLKSMIKKVENVLESECKGYAVEHKIITVGKKEK